MSEKHPKILTPEEAKEDLIHIFEEASNGSPTVIGKPGCLDVIVMRRDAVAYLFNKVKELDEMLTQIIMKT